MKSNGNESLPSSPIRESEHSIQSAFFEWVHLHEERYPVLKLVFAIPNGGQRNVIVASKMKREGVRRGVLDVFVATPDAYNKNGLSSWHGLFIEFKTPQAFRKAGHGLSSYQFEFMQQVMAQGYNVQVMDRWEWAVRFLCAYLGIPCDLEAETSKDNATSP